MFSKIKEKLRGDRTPELPTIDLDKEDALAQLMYYDTQFLIDDSGSMAGSRWNEAREALMGLAQHTLKHDQDGIEIFFLNDVNNGGSVKNDEQVRQLFYAVKPDGGTPIGHRLEELLSAYMARIEGAKTKSGGQDPSKSGIKPLNLIVITDGVPTDDPESVIIAAARRLDAGQFSLTQVGIQFIQVGDDKGASKALKELDSHLHKDHDVRDIVDTRPFSGKKLTPELLMAMLLGGINRRVDQIKKPGKQ
ncbi:hypothetical protein RSOLAG1IB_03191 [Rhizoctonia solani AG-1 IB]|uniref:VWFA domain-containing protein n=1 Tax=Thanatephorus cucumeris (strain AG1-IB / isolate 7/3/14) TaxID=1108050 RepID=M5BU92_THACB|nr:hypothetical protein BN14_04084 [Rhizoctonia solani AG-1 IB]CEL59258.1 hypothetical protein RSOLAG1IB_03191 [Rhizoctonia solani AG-1 IB]